MNNIDQINNIILKTINTDKTISTTTMPRKETSSHSKIITK